MLLQTASVSVKVARYAAHQALAAHVHDRASICLVAAGGYEEHIRSVSAAHRPGHALICPADEPHAQRIGAAGVLKVVLYPDEALLDFIDGSCRLAQAPVARSPEFARLAARLAAEVRRPDQASALACDALAMETAALFHRAASTDAAAPPRWLSAARDFVHANLADDFSLAALGRAVGRHPAHLARAFRRAFGTSVGGYARRIRLEEAMQRVRETRRPLAEIAADCGYADQSHMARAFRTALGLSPSAYRGAVAGSAPMVPARSPRSSRP